MTLTNRSIYGLVLGNPRSPSGQSVLAQQGLARPPQRNLWFFIACVCFLSAILRFWNIGGQPLWLDEAYSLWFSSQSLGDLWSAIPEYEPNPSFYYTLLKAWTMVFGDAEWALRSLSAVFGVLTAPLIFLIGKILGGPRYGFQVGAVASLLYVASPVHIQFAQETRSYSLLTFGAALSLTGFSLFVRREVERRSSHASDGRLSPGNLAAGTTAFVLGSALTLWAHNLGALYTLAVGCLWLAWGLLAGFHERRNFWLFFLSWTLVILLWSPQLYYLTREVSSVTGGFWIKEPTPTVVFQTLTALLTSQYYPLRKPFVLLFAVLVFAGIWFSWKRVSRLIPILLVGLVVIPLAADLAITYLLVPVFLKRTLIWLSIPFFLLVGFGCAAVSARLVKAALLGVLCLASVKAVLNYYERFSKEPWREIVAITQAEESLEAAVLLYPNSIELPYRYYADRAGTAGAGNEIIVVPGPFPTRNLDRPYSGSLVPYVAEEDIDRVAEATKRYEVVWSVSRHADLFDPGERVPEGFLRAGFTQAHRQEPWRGITVTRYERASGTD